MRRLGANAAPQRPRQRPRRQRKRSPCRSTLPRAYEHRVGSPSTGPDHAPDLHRFPSPIRPGGGRVRASPAQKFCRKTKRPGHDPQGVLEKAGGGRVRPIETPLHARRPCALNKPVRVHPQTRSRIMERFVSRPICAGGSSARAKSRRLLPLRLIYERRGGLRLQLLRRPRLDGGPEWDEAECDAASDEAAVPREHVGMVDGRRRARRKELVPPVSVPRLPGQAPRPTRSSGHVPYRSCAIVANHQMRVAASVSTVSSSRQSVTSSLST
jgi:hypothetical protein